MGHKWLARTPWHKPDGRSASGNGNGKHQDERNPVTQAHLSPVNSSADLVGNVTDLEAELLSTEDIYREAGIAAPRKGYSIKKVVEMLHSEHICGLSNEMKRAAVLMALHAAGIPIDEVLKDARARQEALDSYEAAQQKQIEAEWARKAEENLQIEAELEHAKAYYQARIERNLDCVAQEKAAFGNWLTLKQQEWQSMSEAVELCSKSAASVSPDGNLTSTSTHQSSASAPPAVGKRPPGGNTDAP